MYYKAVLLSMVLGMATISAHSEEPDQLSRALLKIRYDDAANGVTKDKLEQKALRLLNGKSTPEDRGKVLATIVFIYSQHGYSGVKDAGTSAKYCEEALKYPQDIWTAAQLYGYWVGDLDDDARLKGKEFRSERRSMSEICLTGLKFVMAHETTHEMQSVPGVMRIGLHVSTSSAKGQELIKERDAQVSARKNIQLQNDLILMRNQLMNRCVDLYARPPYDSDEFETSLNGHIADQDARNQMLAELKKRVDARTGKTGLKPDHLPGHDSRVPSKTLHAVPKTPSTSSPPPDN